MCFKYARVFGSSSLCVYCEACASRAAVTLTTTAKAKTFDATKMLATYEDQAARGWPRYMYAWIAPSKRQIGVCPDTD